MSKEPRRALLVATIGRQCPYCGNAMEGPDRWPTRDHIKPKSKGYCRTGNQTIVCAPCNKAKGSLSLRRFANRLVRCADPRAAYVAAFIERLPESG